MSAGVVDEPIITNGFIEVTYVTSMNPLVQFGSTANPADVEISGALTLQGKVVEQQFYSENATNTYAAYSDEAANTFFAWNSNNAVTNVTGSHQTIGPGYHSFSNIASTGKIYFEMELQSNTASSLLFSLNNTATWTGVQLATWSLTSSFQTFTFVANAFPNGHMSMHFNLTPTGHSPAAATGTVNMKNLRCYTIGGSVAISWHDPYQ